MLSGGILTLAVTSITGMIILGGLGAVAIESSTSRSALDRIRRLANAAYEGIVVVQDGPHQRRQRRLLRTGRFRTGRPAAAAARFDLLTFDSDGPTREGVRREGVLQPIDGGREIPVEVFSRLMDDGARIRDLGPDGPGRPRPARASLGRGEDPLPGRARRPDRPAQPQFAAGAPGRGPGSRRGLGREPVGDLHRPGPLQGSQRPARPPGGRRPAGRDRASPADA
jgi:hypothetical protein